ncbi:MAG TPA: ABC transporter ATP-binding protein [Fimbriimonas sp.]
MNRLLSMDRLAIRPDGPTLSLALGPGESLAIVGPGGSGKTRLLRTLAGFEKPQQGTLEIKGDVFLPLPLPRRTRLQSFAQQFPELGDLFATTSLWEARQTPTNELTPSLAAAAEIMPALVRTQGIVFLDGHLDRLDPWMLEAYKARLRKQAANGLSLVATTNRPDLLEGFSHLIVMRRHEARFSGTCEDLLRYGVRHELQVETQRQPGVRALVEPFEATVEETNYGLRIWAKEGQELAARLMLEGYGDVRLVVHRAPSIVEALQAIP